MDVIHKTFPGGYKFGVFKGQPSKEIKKFIPYEDVKALNVVLGNGKSAEKALNLLGRTSIKGPESVSLQAESIIKSPDVKNIIVSSVEVEPYSLSSEAILMGDNTSKFIEAIKSIHNAFVQAKVTLVLGENQTVLLKLFKENLDNTNWLDIVTIAAKYPANLKEISIPTILDKKYPVGYSSASIGVLFLSVNDVLMVSKIISKKETIVTTYVALSGPGWKENLILEVPIGTPISEIKEMYLAEGEVRLIRNSILTESVFSDDDKIDFNISVIIALPEDRKRKSLYFLRSGKDADSFSLSFLSSLMPKKERVSSTSLNGERRACVSCTYCQEVCPVGLIPHLLHRHVDKKIINTRLADYRIYDCLECGLCDYVCPSKIEISSDIKRGKTMLEENEISHTKYILPKCDMVKTAKEETKNE